MTGGAAQCGHVRGRRSLPSVALTWIRTGRVAYARLGVGVECRYWTACVRLEGGESSMLRLTDTGELGWHGRHSRARVLSGCRDGSLSSKQWNPWRYTGDSMCHAQGSARSAAAVCMRMHSCGVSGCACELERVRECASARVCERGRGAWAHDRSKAYQPAYHLFGFLTAF